MTKKRISEPIDFDYLPSLPDIGYFNTSQSENNDIFKT